MTKTMFVESKLASVAKVNDHLGGIGYSNHRFPEGPGTELDDPKKNYLRRVEAADVRVPTRDTLASMLLDYGFSNVVHVYPEHDSDRILTASSQYFRESAGMLFATR